ncbi:MAG: lysophospholipid acyltransferase family protein [Candidatus Omnitrophica bacterium]|nr:lysophospholipid acyltransferase family protein [Candidatus Omnitrophota bacterium]MDD5654708.1 lysophospholipid acyltransferase family protein [Candidatus Omnitrophota bacterium]
MDLKSISKSIKYLCARAGIGLCAVIVKVMPRNLRFLYGFARNFSVIGYHVAVKQRRIALESLNSAFGSSKTPQEIDKIARDCFTYMAKGGIEMLSLMDRPDLIKERVKLENRDRLLSAARKGRGTILVSAHFGNFPLMLARLSMEGFHTGGIMRPMRDEKIEELFLETRKKFKIRTIYSVPRKDCVEESIAALRNNELLFIPLDQNFGTGGIFVDFFGRKAATATGPVILAMRAKAAILPCFIVRQSDDTHKIIFEPEFELVEGKDHEDTVQKNIQRLTAIIESYIRKYPAEWSWIHRRWKTQPQSKT